MTGITRATRRPKKTTAFPSGLGGVVLMVALTLYPRLLAAGEADLRALEGTDWYGLYLNGQKAGYSMNDLSVQEDGTVTVTEDAHFQVTMVGAKQDMQIFSKRIYGPDGSLRVIDYRVVDPAGVKEFHAVADGEDLVLRSTIAGATVEQRMPLPSETLRDAIQQAELVAGGAQVGDSLSFSLFDPMYQKEIAGISQIEAIEERVLNGASTKVYRIHTELDMGVTSTSHVTAQGVVLEDVVASIITQRLEPENMAKDVGYSNDVIVSNAAMVNTPIANPRTRPELKLRLHGPLGNEHLYSDERQEIVAENGSFLFTGKRIRLDGFSPVPIPIEDESVQEWLKPTTFIQSEDPKVVEKAHEIVGNEKNAYRISERLCHWVYDHVKTTFSAQLTNSREVLERLEGDCTEHSVLFIGLARAAGLPAREVAGLIYMDGDEPGFFFHQWAKVWIGKWIDVDPTFNQPLADATHIKLGEGDLFDQMRLIPVIGRIQVEVLRDGT